ncbi:glucokinase [Chitinasiproducens palmae]|uniref:Glucokinase n=1 Tax=Chitinasiproducens palmae TaxID=1770053 RepID=A0A1H2PPC2_9BURK|nr:glucokinase [Chitinasiproducens palmae]SDV47738.1 glucokinase [Chitinasiproducens palmae]
MSTVSLEPPCTSQPHPDGPRLLADVGGTNARFALEFASGDVREIRTYVGARYANLDDAIRAYFADTGATHVRHAAIAIANPVTGDTVSMTNHDWSFSIEGLRRALGFETFLVVNDFAALALAVPGLADHERHRVGGGVAQARQVIAVLGAGTGLGVAGVLPLPGSIGGTGEPQRWAPLSSEGGHMSFAPQDAREDGVLAFARRRWPHVSYERLASGPGLELIHAALCERDGVPDEGLDAAAIGQRAQAALRDGAPCREAETVEVFCGVLGSFAGSVALVLCAVGGVYIGGGVVPKLGALFDRSCFRERFESKGRFGDYLGRIPTFVITAEYPAFAGASALLRDHLAQRSA